MSDRTTSNGGSAGSAAEPAATEPAATGHVEGTESGHEARPGAGSGAGEEAANGFLTGSLPRVFLRTALPIVAIMAMNGLFNIVDAAFLGLYVGPEALAAVTLMFPLVMLMAALSSLVSTGMASVLARRLGAGRRDDARAVFVGAHALALIVSAVLVLLFVLGGAPTVRVVANGSEELARMGWTYLSISVLFSPMMFLLSLQGDALRCEGRLAAMSVLAIGSSLLNIGFNYLLIAVLGLGVAGSALGTVAAQSVAFVAVWVYRRRSDSVLAWARLRGSWSRSWRTGWREYLALGTPQSLNFLGISLLSGVVILSVQVWAADSYEATVGAYGIITRIMTFSFLPLMGINLAFQTIVGNNVGAGLWGRADHSLRLALVGGLLYCATIQATLFLFRGDVAGLFVDDPAIRAETARILPVATAMYTTFGPVMMLTGYFQALGEARRAAVLGLARNYLLALPLTLLLPFAVGEIGIWLAGPTAETTMLLLAALLLRQRARVTGLRFGLFHRRAAEPTPDPALS